MEIKCTVEELKELIKKDTSVAGTTDVVSPLKNTNFAERIAKYMTKNLTNHDIHEEQLKSFLN